MQPPVTARIGTACSFDVESGDSLGLLLGWYTRPAEYTIERTDRVVERLLWEDR